LPDVPGRSRRQYPGPTSSEFELEDRQVRDQLGYPLSPAVVRSALAARMVTFMDRVSGNRLRRRLGAVCGRVWIGRSALGLVALSVVFGFGSEAALAAPVGQVVEFSSGLDSGTVPYIIASGPDGNVWFTAYGTTHAVWRITPSGQITPFSTGLGPGSFPNGIATGPDGNTWFTDNGTTSAIGRITPSGQITEYSTGLGAGSGPSEIAPGPDGNVWFTDLGTTKAIGRITPSGQITEFSSGLANSYMQGIAPGADGNVWFTDDGSTAAIGRITPSGQITEFSSGLEPNSNPWLGIAPGPDGNVWFTDAHFTPAIGRITPTGQITEFSSPSFIDTIEALAPGADGNLWFTDQGLNTGAVGSIGTGAPAASQAPPTVTGSGQAGSLQLCKGEVWADWAGVQPILNALDGYQWLLDGNPLTGQTSQAYTPTSSQVGHALSCRLTVTYPTPLFVTETATSAPITVAAPAPPSNPITTGPPMTSPTQPKPPRVEITTASISSKRRSASFSFKALGKASGFRCALTRVPSGRHNHRKTPTPVFSTCRSPKRYQHLAAGKYMFQVRALSGGAVGTTATKRFTIT
jgi:streptogramin lyase